MTEAAATTAPDGPSGQSTVADLIGTRYLIRFQEDTRPGIDNSGPGWSSSSWAPADNRQHHSNRREVVGERARPVPLGPAPAVDCRPLDMPGAPPPGTEWPVRRRQCAELESQRPPLDFGPSRSRSRVQVFARPKTHSPLTTTDDNCCRFVS